MKKEEQIKILTNLHEENMQVIESKQGDYADPNADVLGNFKRLSNAAKLLNVDVHTPTGYALFMVMLKLDRINNLLYLKKEPLNESIKDSFIDADNYLKLAYLCNIENQ